MAIQVLPNFTIDDSVPKATADAMRVELERHSNAFSELPSPIAFTMKHTTSLVGPGVDSIVIRGNKMNDTEVKRNRGILRKLKLWGERGPDSLWSLLWNAHHAVSPRTLMIPNPPPLPGT